MSGFQVGGNGSHSQALVFSVRRERGSCFFALAADKRRQRILDRNQDWNLRAGEAAVAMYAKGAGPSIERGEKGAYLDWQDDVDVP